MNEGRVEKRDRLKEKIRLEELLPRMSLRSNVYNLIDRFLNDILVFSDAY